MPARSAMRIIFMLRMSRSSNARLAVDTSNELRPYIKTAGATFLGMKTAAPACAIKNRSQRKCLRQEYFLTMCGILITLH